MLVTGVEPDHRFHQATGQGLILFARAGYLLAFATVAARLSTGALRAYQRSV